MKESLTYWELAGMFNNTAIRNILNSNMVDPIYEIFHQLTEVKLFSILCFWCPMNSTRQKWCEEEGQTRKTPGRSYHTNATKGILWCRELLRLTHAHRLHEAEEAGVLTPRRLHFLSMTGRQQVGVGRPTVRINVKESEKHWIWYLLIGLGDY